MKKLVIWYAVGIFMFSSAVSAHTGLKASVPANNSILQVTPQQLALEFRSEVRLVKLGLRNSKAKQIKFDFKPSAQGMKKVNYPLPKLATGSYRVDWMVMGSDTHKVTGYYNFIVLDTNH